MAYSTATVANDCKCPLKVIFLCKPFQVQFFVFVACYVVSLHLQILFLHSSWFYPTHSHTDGCTDYTVCDITALMMVNIYGLNVLMLLRLSVCVLCIVFA